ncbi:MAG: hypothetical protein H3C45_00080 [Bacteroidia bacterium]|nr:hypothetical protein [Bacteroidia bacterium]MCC7532570.1 hypothetical protein [Bacteroidia bacterium]
MKFKFTILFLIVLVLLIITPLTDTSAQGCPMCKSTLEEARKNGSMVGSSLNNGILYLLALPYLVATAFGIIWYKNTRNKKSSTASNE